MKKYQIKKKFIKIFIRRKLITLRTVWRYLRYYKKIRQKYLWKLKYKYQSFMRSNFIHKRIKFKNFKNFKNSKKKIFFLSIKTIWFWVFIRQKIRSLLLGRWALFPKRKLHYTNGQLWQYTNMKLMKFTKIQYWKKLRKRWHWHRQIKFCVKINFLTYLKKYFAYNIAARKCFHKVDSWSAHKNIFNRQLPLFLVQKKLIPVIKKASKLCKQKRIVINGEVRDSSYIMKPFDILTFYFRKIYIYLKQKKYRYSRKNFRLINGLLYNKKIKSYIFITDSNRYKGKLKYKHFFYYAFYRNILK